MNNLVHAPTLDDFAQCLRQSNPFLANRVDRIGADLVDVADIHQAEFQRILDLGRQASDENRGIGVVVWGEAGIGKSHLLARLARWAPERACFIYLHNVQASPQRLPRYLVKCVVNVLTAGLSSPLWKTPLFHLLNAAVREALGGDHVKGAPWSEIEAAYHRWIEQCVDEGAVDRTVQEILLRFFRAANPRCPECDEAVARLAVRWLAGDFLDADEARQIGLRAETGNDPVALLDNQQIKQVLVGLTRIARSGRRLFLLCFDQVDNLDQEQVRGLARFLHDLLDSAGNLLVLTTGVRETLLGFRDRGVITETSWNRIGQFTLLLARLRADQAHALVAARLQPFREMAGSLPGVPARCKEDPLFPLSEIWWRERTGRLTDFRPRDLLTWAGERWQVLQDGLQNASIQDWLARWPTFAESFRPQPQRSLEEIIDEKMLQKVTEQAALCTPATRPASEENLQGLVHESLQQCVGNPDLYAVTEVRGVSPRRSGPLPPYDLAVYLRRGDESMTEVGVRFITSGSATSVSGSLRRLVQDTILPDRVLLVTDERQPLPLGVRGREYLQELQNRGPKVFQHVQLSFAEYAMLDALQAVVGLARAGDLEIEYPIGQRHTVSTAEVIASFHRSGRYRNHRLLSYLLCDWE